MKTNLRTYISVCLMTVAFAANGQELRCNIQLVTTQIQGSNKSVTDALQTALYEFVNSRAWTNNAFSVEERIECNMLLNIKSLVGNEFTGTLQVQSRRPVFNSAYSTILLNFQDENLKFTYVEGEPLEFSEITYQSNLTSIIAFYIYIILGMDYDSFSQGGGTPYFRKAETIVANAQKSGEKGWRAYEGSGSNKNRYWIAQNLTDDRYRGVREFSYKYHRLGLDRMNTRPNEVRSEIADYMKLLQDVYRRKPDPYTLLVQMVSESKSNEWMELFAVSPADEKSRVVKILKEIDPASISKYDNL
ncbi:MAG: DUF4835 family protein [Bacteroidales bacterium]|jgi:hypothetical protein|nr:DUF4835 family protein [Bacteroidales bacterium]